MDLDRRPDAHMLEGCCVTYDAAVDAYETIQKQGWLIAKKAWTRRRTSWSWSM